MKPIKKTVELTFFHKSVIPKEKGPFLIIDEFGYPDSVELNSQKKWVHPTGYPADFDFFYCKIPRSLIELKEKL